MTLSVYLRDELQRRLGSLAVPIGNSQGIAFNGILAGTSLASDAADYLVRIDDTLQREVRPLIETKFEIRARIHAELPGFLASLAKHLSVDHSAQWNENVP